VRLCDVNIFVQAHRADAPEHKRLRHWLERALEGNDIPDAWFAALAIEAGCEWITLDRGFARYPGLRTGSP